tara:strand:- start:352 stop:1725 length:1374 start_codon:yes stop_codon:yes gene_type:complete
MRLIGGNISDTPVKEIADGSAFSAGGAGSVNPYTIGAFSSVTTISGWDAHSEADSGTAGLVQVDYCKFDDDDYGFAWRSNADDEVKFGHLTLNASTGAPTFGAEQDLSGTFTRNTADGTVMIATTESGVCAIAQGHSVGTDAAGIDVGRFTLSSDSLTLTGSVLLDAVSRTGLSYTQGAAGLIVVSADTVVTTHIDYHGTAHPGTGSSPHNGINMTPMKITGTQSVGTTVASTRVFNGGTQRIFKHKDNGVNFYMPINGHLTYWTVSEGSTPSIAETTADIYGAIKQPFYGGTGNGGRAGRIMNIPEDDNPFSTVFFDTETANMCFWKADPGDGNYSVTQDGVDSMVRVGHPQYGPMLANKANGALIYIDKVGSVHRFILVGAHVTTHLTVTPMTVNATDGTFSVGPMSFSTNLTPNSTHSLWGAVVNSGKTAITIIAQDDATTVRYVTVPITDPDA